MSWRKLAIAVMAVSAFGSMVFVSQAGAKTDTAAPKVTIVQPSPSCSSDIACFQPARITIKAGTTLTWKNTTELEHAVTRCTTKLCSGVGPGSGTDPNFSKTYNKFIFPGKTFTVQFNKTGVYNYYCKLHGYAAMHGTVVVIATSTS